MKNKLWSKQDDLNLIRWYPKYTKWELAHMLHVTKSALEARLGGLRRHGRIKYKHEEASEEHRALMAQAMVELAAKLGCSPLKAQEMVADARLKLPIAPRERTYHTADLLGNGLIELRVIGTAGEQVALDSAGKHVRVPDDHVAVQVHPKSLESMPVLKSVRWLLENGFATEERIL